MFNTDIVHTVRQLFHFWK